MLSGNVVYVQRIWRDALPTEPRIGAEAFRDRIGGGTEEHDPTRIRLRPIAQTELAPPRRFAPHEGGVFAGLIGRRYDSLGLGGAARRRGDVARPVAQHAGKMLGEPAQRPA